jgi:hypothetical protein
MVSNIGGSQRWDQPEVQWVRPGAGIELPERSVPQLPSITVYERLTGLLFARPASEITKKILPHLHYFDLDSRENFTVTCMGYFIADDTQSCVTTVDGDRWGFSDEAFIKTKDHLESITSWRYSGGVDLLICNELIDVGTGFTSLNKRRAMCLNMDKLIQNATIFNFETFFQSIITFVKDNPAKSTVWHLSNEYGFRLALAGLKGAILDRLPKGAEREVSAAFDFVVWDISSPRFEALEAIFRRLALT